MNTIANVLFGIILVILGLGGAYIKSLKSKSARLEQEKSYLKAQNRVQQLNSQQSLKQAKVEVVAAKTEATIDNVLSSLESEKRKALDDVERTREREETILPGQTGPKEPASENIKDNPILPKGELSDEWKEIAAQQAARTREHLADGTGNKFVQD